MRNRLKLKGSEVDAYAVIYGFSQDNDSKYEGSLQWIATAIGVSKRAMVSILGNLTKKGVITKIKSNKKGIKCFDYRANYDEESSKNYVDGSTDGEVTSPTSEETSPVQPPIVQLLHHDGEVTSTMDGEVTSPHITIRDISSDNKFSGSKEPPQNAVISKNKNNSELTPEQLKLYHTAKACFETSERSKALMYCDKTSTAREMQHLKMLVIRCNNIAPEMSADFMQMVLEHFRVLCNGKYKGKMVFTPHDLMTSWIWSRVIDSLPEKENKEIRESIKGMFNDS